MTVTLFDYPFMINALRAGTIVAVVSGAMGWFMVLRRQTFAGHTLSLVGFPGAAGAILIGLSPAFGYFGFCVAAGVIIAMASPPVGSALYSEESAVIGSVQAFSLACGFLFVNLYHGNLNGLTNLLFGLLGAAGNHCIASHGLLVLNGRHSLHPSHAMHLARPQARQAGIEPATCRFGDGRSAN